MSHPNIVIVSLDSVRADHLPMYGYDHDTMPFLSSMADEGLVFENSYVPGVGTPTSFGGTFTGDYINAVQSCTDIPHWQRALRDRKLLPEVLSHHGYYCGGIHANGRLHRDYGWNRGWEAYGDYQWAEASAEGANERWGDIKKDVLLPLIQKFGLGGQAITARNIVFKHSAYTPWESLWADIAEFVETAPEPWFLWVLSVDTHHPWYAPKKYQEWDQPGFRKSHLWNWLMRYHHELAGERHPEIVNAYNNELRHADAFLEALNELLESTGNDDVPFILHSDHGDDLGEHGRYGHAPMMYDTVVRVPLIMRNVGRTGRITRPITHLDLPNTVLRLAGSGKRLESDHTLIDNPREEEFVIIENMTDDGDLMAAATDGKWKVLYHPESGWEAYHQPSDRFEQNNRLGDHPQDLKRAVVRHRQNRLPNHPGGSSDEEDESDLRDVRENLANLG